MVYNATIERSYENDKHTITYDGTESDLWKQIAMLVKDSHIPNSMVVDSTHGFAAINVKQRGTYVENGVKYPSMFVTVKNNIDLCPSSYEKAYLTCIHPESNNYKAYILRPEGSDIWADYGSIDEVHNGNARTVQTPYPSYMYWIRYYEKLSKGYKDQSDVYFDTPVTNTEVKNVSPTGLYAKLLRYAKKMVSDVLVSQNFTKKQIEKSWKLYKELQTKDTVEEFNKILCELMQISPRKRNPLHDHVSRFLANKTADFERILDYEESLLNAMDSVSSHVNGGNNAVSFEDFGISVVEATKAEFDFVLNQVNDELKKKVRKVWKVTPNAQKEAFDNYCKKRKIKNIKYFWHGSRNENWESIIRQGLLLNPNAVINGKMFGNGIYFAPSARKSYGYTSCSGSYWARGNDNTGFMGLYATAYGNPYYPRTAGNMKPYMEQNNKDCVHARKADVGLYNDEVIFYNEKAMCLEYFVEFSA